MDCVESVLVRGIALIPHLDGGIGDRRILLESPSLCLCSVIVRCAMKDRLPGLLGFCVQKRKEEGLALDGRWRQ